MLARRCDTTTRLGPAARGGRQALELSDCIPDCCNERLRRAGQAGIEGQEPQTVGQGEVAEEGYLCHAGR